VVFGFVPVTALCQYAAGDQAMHVNMTAQVLSPGVEHRCHAQFAAKVPGVAPKRVKRVPDCGEQTAVDHVGMELNPAVQGVR